MNEGAAGSGSRTAWTLGGGGAVALDGRRRRTRPGSVAPSRWPGKTVLIVGAGGGVGSPSPPSLAVNVCGARCVIANVLAAAAGRMRGYGAAETVDHTEVSLPGSSTPGTSGRHRRPDRSGQRRGGRLRRACRARPVPGGTSPSPRNTSPIPAPLAAAGVTGTNFNFAQYVSGELLEQVADDPRRRAASPRRRSSASPWSKRPLPPRPGAGFTSRRWQRPSSRCRASQDGQGDECGKSSGDDLCWWDACLPRWRIRATRQMRHSAVGSLSGSPCTKREVGEVRSALITPASGSPSRSPPRARSPRPGASTAQARPRPDLPHLPEGSWFARRWNRRRSLSRPRWRPPPQCGKPHAVPGLFQPVQDPGPSFADPGEPGDSPWSW